jgi:hypothetical protein
MSDYLSRLAARNLNLAEMVQPRLLSLFEPPSSDVCPVFEQHFGSGEQDQVFVSDETEPYAHTLMLPSSPLLPDHSSESTLSEVVRAEKVGTARQNVADPQTPILSQPQPDLDEAKRDQGPEIIENFPVATSSEMESPDRRRSTYSAAVKTETDGTVRRKSVDTQPLTSEPILNRPRPDLDEAKRRPAPEKMETIPATSCSETHRTESQSSSRQVAKQTSRDQRQQGSITATIRTETVGMVRRKAVDPQLLTSEPILNRPRPDLDEAKRRPAPEKMETIPATSCSETHRTESQSSSRQVSKQTSPDQRQQGSITATIRTETVGMVRRKAVDPQSLTSEPILNRPRPDPDEAKRHPSPEMVETTTVATSGETASSDLRQRASPAVMVRTETDGKVRRKAADAPSPSSEPIQSQSLPYLEKTQRRPSPENARNFAVTASNKTQNVVHLSAVKADHRKISSLSTSQTRAEAHPFSRKTQLQSSPEINQSPEVGIDGEKRPLSRQGSTEKRVLPAHSSRASLIAQPDKTRFVEPTKQTTSKQTETNPTIQVKIGRVEVRATAPAAPTSSPPRSATQSAQKLSLDEYLKQRDGGRL